MFKCTRPIYKYDKILFEVELKGMIYMSKIYKLSELIIDNENPYYRDEEKLKNHKDKK